MNVYVTASVLFVLANLATAIEYCVLPDLNLQKSSRKFVGNPSCNFNFSLNSLSNTTSLNDTVISFLPGQHYLYSVWHIRDILNLTLSSMSERAIVTCRANESGLFFMDASDVTIDNLEFRFCGITGSYIKYANRAALVFYRSLNIMLTGIIIQEPWDAGGFSLNHMHGKVLIRDSLFKNGRLSKFNVKSGSFIGHEENLRYSEVLIFNTTFENNSYSNLFRHTCENRDRRLSAGLAIVLTLGNITVNLNHVTLRNNAGCGGGNLAVLLYQNLTNHEAMSPVNVAIFNDSLIEGGFSNVGGGILILLNWQKLFNNFTISNTTIANNRAVYNGGGIFVKITQAKDLHHSSLVSISQCRFEMNKLNETKSNGGYALQVTTFFMKGFRFHSKPQLNVTISTTTFINHHQDPQTSLKLSGNAVLYLKNSPLIMVRDIVIKNNTCSGMTAIGSNVILAGNVSISHNKAHNGGGIHLCSDALLYFTRHTLLKVTDNSANYTGGGINVESGCTLNMPACFYQFYNYTFDNTTKAIVEGNTAKYAGDNIYGGSVTECYLIEGHHFPWHIFDKLFQVPMNSSPKNSSISSMPQSLYLYISNKTIGIYPGQSVTFNATIYGQNRGVTPGTVYGSLSDSKTVFFRRGDSIQTLHYENNVSFGIISYRFFSTEQGTNFSLTLRVSEGSLDPHTNATSVNFQFLHCPLGLKLNRKGTQSVCSCTYIKKINSHTKSVKCYISKKQIIRYYPDLWIGSIPGGMNTSDPPIIAVAIVCPQDYCQTKEVTLNLTKDPFINNTEQCNFNRSGVLCGKCTQGKSVILGSSECRVCSNYYLILILLFALAGPALVFVISFLNLTVSSATLNGIIFYANIVQIYGFSLFYKNTVIFKIFISWLNLDFGISTCLFDGMDGFSKALMQFVFPVYLWIIAGVVIWLSKRSKVVVNLFGTNLVQVLATLILLSYTKLIRAATDAIMFTKLLTPTAPHSSGHLRWSIDGNLQFLEGKHIIIFTVGVIFGLLSLPYLLILVFIGQLPRISHWPFFSWINKLKPFLDCYTGSLSSKGRFWVGLLLAVRVFLLIIYSINISSANVSKMTTTIVVVMVLLLLSLAAPKGIYDKYHLNVLEILSIVNLGVLFSGLLCSYHYHMDSVKELFVILSLGVCIVLFLLVIATHINQRFGCLKKLKWIWERSQSNANRHDDDSDKIVTHCSLRMPPYQLECETDRLLPPHD